jgi:murein L,D-transpeptidase YcbB/YkuD
MRMKRSALAVVLTVLFFPAIALSEAEFVSQPDLLWLRVSVEDNVLDVVRGDQVVLTYQVSVGKPTHPTPQGSFSISRIIWNPGWVPPPSPWARGKTPKAPGEPGNPMKKVKIFFQDPDYYIHGTGEVGALGRSASHGCIRMEPSEATALARLLMEENGDERETSWFDRLFRSRRSATVRLATPVPIYVAEDRGHLVRFDRRDLDRQDESELAEANQEEQTLPVT